MLPDIKKAFFAAALTAGLLCISLPVSADTGVSKPIFGINASVSGYLNTAGFVYDFSTVYSVKPQFTFYQVNTGVKRYGLAVECDRNTAVTDSFTVYYGIRGEYLYGYSHYHYSDGSSDTSQINDFTLSAVIGGRYMLNERFGFFADTGFGYTGESREDVYRYSSGSADSSDSWYNIISIQRAYLGAVFYIF